MSADHAAVQRTDFDQFMVPNYAPAAFIPVRGEGARVWDQSGRELIDFGGGIAVNCLGHAHPALVKALTEQAHKLWHVSNVFTNEPALRLARQLVEATFAERVFFCNSGAEANEAAFKLARRYAHDVHGADKFEIISAINSFHGRTIFTVNVGGQPKYSDGFGPRPEGIRHVPFNDLSALHAAVDAQTVAILLEPIQGEAGVIPATEHYLKGVERLCRELGILLILDEVQTGIGRCGTLLAEQQYGVRADIITLGKGLGGGVPLAALLARGKACCFEVGELEGTHHGNALMASAGLAVLEAVLEHGFMDHVRESGLYLGEGLARLAYRYDHGQLRGHGLMWGLTLSDDSADAVVKAALHEGLIINAPQPNCLRFTPALTVSKSNIDEMLLRLARAFSRVRTAQLQCRKGVAV